MAADQLKKCSKVSNAIRPTSWEMQKVKKKKLAHCDLNTKSNISLEWDGKKERVVSKKEQISIARRELTPFLPQVLHCQNALGDVFAAPPELFELNNLNGLLSYEVWQTHLSAQERDFLTQFLPEGDDPHKMVHELFAGNNVYFGNPFPKWGASVCSGHYHPDAILRQEQCNKANKIEYYSELQEYHTKMIGSLQLWKERWASCMNPDNDFLQKIQRSRKVFQKSGSSHENGTQYGPEDDLGATSGSCSWDADDRSHTSDSPDRSVGNGETLKRRVSITGLARSVARPEKGDKLRKLNIECSDGAKYMSYIKVSKEQHERVKSSMRHSNTSILPKSLNNVLGNLDSFCVQPFEMFEQEERHKLHHHWLRLVKKDLPAGFENWKIWQSAKWQLTKSLTKEMEDKWNSNTNDVQQVLTLYTQNEELIVGCQDEEQEQSVSSNPCHQQMVDAESNDVLIIAPEENMEGNGDSVFQSEADLNASDCEIMEESDHESDQSQRLPHIAIHINNHDDHNDSNNVQSFSPMAISTSNAAFPSSLVEYTDNINHADAPVGEQFPPPSDTSEIWLPPGSLPNVYYHQPTSVTNGYPPIGDLSLRQAQSSFLHRRSDGGDSFFNPYCNQDRNELLLHSLFKDPGSSQYLHEQKLSRLGFHPPASDAMLGTGQFARNICSSLPLDPRQNIQENIFADGGGGRFSIPRQEPLLPLNHVQDWPGDGVVNMPMAAASHHRLSQNWFPGDEVVSNGWSAGVIPNHDIVNGGQVSDESLFSVLSECNGLRSGVHFGPTEFIQSFVGTGRGLVPSTTANILPPRAARGTGVNYMSGNESQLGWINLPNGGKSFGRSWNDKEL